MVKINKVTYLDQINCYQLDNDTVQVIVTTEIGPRVICYRFTGEKNIFGELGPEAVVKSVLGDYRLRGGHRLWHAPESSPRSYVPDDDPVTVKLIAKDSIRLTQPVESATNIEKEILVKLDASGTRVIIEHKLTNKGVWPVELAAWAPTIMRGGGTTIIPNEPYIPEDDKVLPARPVVIWHYTDMRDLRWIFGKKYIRLRTDRNLKTQQKIGVMNKQGWAAYLVEKTLFIKRFPFLENAKYPDYGCNFESYTAGDFMEVESLGPLVTLEPKESTVHIECWHLFRGVDAGGDTEEDISATVVPLVERTERI